jgi:predicted dehydrogenase
MTDPLRVGIVGAGYIAGVHSAAYRTATGTFAGKVPPIELIRVADADSERAAALASSWGWQTSVGDWSAVTRADDVDVVDICTPNDLHAEIAIDALRHGKHVVCEKPLAPEPATAREMAAAAGAAPGLAQICFYYRTWPATAWARELIDSGAIGRPLHLRGWMLQDYAADPKRGLGWRALTTRGGAGALDDLGSHILDIARFLMGEVTAVRASCRSMVERDGPPLIDAASVILDFASEASGVIEASWALPGHSCDLGFDVVGEDGAIRFDWERANELRVKRDRELGFERVLLGPRQTGAEDFIQLPGQQMGYRDAFTLGIGALLQAAAKGEATVSPSFEDGLKAAELTHAIQCSSAERVCVEL